MNFKQRRAVIYARFSSDRQRAESIDAQIRACREYADRYNFVVTAVYADEAVSGKGSATQNRAKYQKLLRDAKNKKFDVILIHKFDRIARNVQEHVNLELKLKESDIELIAVAQDFGNTNEGKLIRTLMWGLSEYYIDNLASEVKKGHRETALQGKHNGGYAPFGYDIVDQKYVINDLEAVYVKKMFLAAQKRSGFKALVREMAAMDIKGKRGKPIKYPQIYEILRNEKYTGVYVYSAQEEKNRIDRRKKPNAIRVEGVIPTIIEKNLFDEVQVIMNERKQTGRNDDYLCSGLVYCGKCGAKMHASSPKRKGHTYPIYSCSKHCGIGTVHIELVDEAAIAYKNKILSNESQEALTLALMRYQSFEKTRVSEFNYSVRSKIAEKQEQYDALMNKLANPAIPDEVTADIAEKMKEIKADIATLKEVKAPQDFSAGQITDWINALKNAPAKEAIPLLIERIEIHKDKEKDTIEINVVSALTSIVSKNGCGGSITILRKTFPEYFFFCTYTFLRSDKKLQ